MSRVRFSVLILLLLSISQGKPAESEICSSKDPEDCYPKVFQATQGKIDHLIFENFNPLEKDKKFPKDYM
jgi:hypothetical protein